MFNKELRMLLVVFIVGFIVFFVWNYLESKFLRELDTKPYEIPEKINIVYKPQDFVVLFSRGKKGN